MPWWQTSAELFHVKLPPLTRSGPWPAEPRSIIAGLRLLGSRPLLHKDTTGKGPGDVSPGTICQEPADTLNKFVWPRDIGDAPPWFPSAGIARVAPTREHHARQS